MAVSNPDEYAYVVVLYGSKARGDDDSLSDCDVLILGNLPEEFSYDLPANASVVTYTWPEFSAMGEYGSLFLRHLQKESQILSGNAQGRSAYMAVIEMLPEYGRVIRDLRSFHAAIDDCVSALNAGDTSVEFELASVATIVRHASILGCYLSGFLEFGRNESVRQFCRIGQLPAEIAAEFPEVYQFRISYMRGAPSPSGASVGYALRWCRYARLLLEEVANAARTYVPRAS
jgi:hypothetical protein